MLGYCFFHIITNWQNNFKLICPLQHVENISCSYSFTIQNIIMGYKQNPPCSECTKNVLNFNWRFYYHVTKAWSMQETQTKLQVFGFIAKVTFSKRDCTSVLENRRPWNKMHFCNLSHGKTNSVSRLCHVRQFFLRINYVLLI